MLKHWVAVNMVEGVGPVKLKKLLSELKTIEAVAEHLNAPIQKAEEEIELAGKKQIKILSQVDEGYPELLKQIHDPPMVLYVRGELRPEDKNSIAIVGTRQATPLGLDLAKKFAGELSALGITIVSGLAFGIDAAAHEGALKAKGRTIAVLGSGADKITPQSNSDLGFDILENGGAIVSEYPLGSIPGSWSFPQRNRIISGLSLGVIVVEGNYESGSMITAKEALEQGREVFAIPGSIELETSKGPHWLIKQGAKLTESIDDVLDELQNVLKINKPPKSKETIKKDYSDLDPEEQKIIACLSNEPKHVDSIANETGLPIAQISSLLLMLEVKKLIKQLPGKLFILP
jgi:DNA processing protein